MGGTVRRPIPAQPKAINREVYLLACPRGPHNLCRSLDPSHSPPGGGSLENGVQVLAMLRLNLREGASPLAKMFKGPMNVHEPIVWDVLRVDLKSRKPIPANLRSNATIDLAGCPSPCPRTWPHERHQVRPPRASSPAPPHRIQMQIQRAIPPGTVCLSALGSTQTACEAGLAGIRPRDPGEPAGVLMRTISAVTKRMAFWIFAAGRGGVRPLGHGARHQWCTGRESRVRRGPRRSQSYWPAAKYSWEAAALGYSPLLDLGRHARPSYGWRTYIPEQTSRQAYDGSAGGYELPIRMPVRKTSRPPITTWRMAAPRGVSMNRWRTQAITPSSTSTTATATAVAVCTCGMR